MCAIVGMINGYIPEGGWGEQYRILSSLLLAAEASGPDATGFVAMTEPLKRPFDGRVVSDKAALRAGDYIHASPVWRRLRHERCQALVGHVRWATHGSPGDNRNNHPFASDDRRFFLVHNGVLSNHADVDERHQLRREGECDSESLLRLVEKIGDARRGLLACLGEFRGSMAVALYDAKSRLVWLATNGGRPLWVCRLRKQRGWFFASTSSILNRGLMKVYGDAYQRQIEIQMPLAPYGVHALGVGGQLICAATGEGHERRIIPTEDD